MVYTSCPYNNCEDLTKEVKIAYKNKLKTPVQINVEPDHIEIVAYLEAAPSMLKPYKSKKGVVDESKTFMDVAVNGIKRNWNNSYELDWVKNQEIPVKVKIIRKDKHPYEKGQRFVKIRRTNISGTSFVMSQPYRWAWGLIKNRGMLESFTLNWSVTNPGTINLNRYIYMPNYEQAAAHEFGHVLGLGDAYDAHYRFGYEAPNTKQFIMNQNKKVQPQEITMVLRAHQTNRMQYFPRKFNFKNWMRAIKDFLS